MKICNPCILKCNKDFASLTYCITFDAYNEDGDNSYHPELDDYQAKVFRDFPISDSVVDFFKHKGMEVSLINFCAL